MSVYRNHLRKVLEFKPERYASGKNVYLPPSTATIKMLAELAPGRHERKKLELMASKIRGTIRVKQSSEINALLQSLLLMNTTQLRLYPGAKFTKTTRSQVVFIENIY